TQTKSVGSKNAVFAARVFFLFILGVTFIVRIYFLSKGTFQKDYVHFNKPRWSRAVVKMR
ncbi:MAG: hypothetical protein O7D30_11150, partial [Rickettsia endosymbiont of Ixodes persulcatus]|nr:hypothetical protein [Rickettsia endosymbiont of Ixodes persulcatus]